MIRLKDSEWNRIVEAMRAVEYLINNSGGVAGLHRNGDIASWDSLRTGGKFEEWLVDFDDALTIYGKPACEYDVGTFEFTPTLPNTD